MRRMHEYSEDDHNKYAVKRTQERSATEFKVYVTREKEIIKSAKTRAQQERVTHKCKGCPYGRFVSDKQVFCLLPLTCIKESRTRA